MFTKLAESNFSNSPFDLEMIGEEISGYTNEENIIVKDIGNLTCIIPTQLQNKRKGKELSNPLRIFN